MEPNPFSLHDDGSLSAVVDLRLYSQDALLKAAHRFTGCCHLHLQTRDADSVLVSFRAKDGKGETLREVAGGFFNELLDQKLRAMVQQESEPVRNLILAHALSRTNLLVHEDHENSGPSPEAGAVAKHSTADDDGPPSIVPTAATSR